MKRTLCLLAAVGIAHGAHAQEAADPATPAAESTVEAPPPAAAQPPAAKPAAKPKPKAGAPKAERSVDGPTPLGDRVATIGVLDKLNGNTQAFTLKPGDTARFGRLTIALKACEATAPWEQPEEHGAFAQVFETTRAGKTQRVFSGWLFANSPALNPFVSKDYDVWVRNCAMRFPDSGPETISASQVGLSSGKAAKAASTAKKSARRDTASASNAL